MYSSNDSDILNDKFQYYKKIKTNILINAMIRNETIKKLSIFEDQRCYASEKE